jgi:hypothetical protein
MMGLREASEGRYVSASDWFSISVDTGQNRVPPNAWSYDTLRRWMAAEKPLSALASEKEL